jgi:heat shock protein HspQ
MKSRTAKYAIGAVVRHRVFPFRGIIFDVDPVFANTEDWWLSMDQPFYHLLAENDETEYVAYVSEQNLLPDNSERPLRHPLVPDVFERDESGAYRMRAASAN